MASSDSQAIDPALRRVHSTGDIPRSPELAHLHERLQALQATLDAAEAARAAHHNQRPSTLPHHARSLTAGDSPITLPPSIYANHRPTSSHQPYPTTHFPPPRHAQDNDTGRERDRLPPVNHGRNTPYNRLLTRFGLGPSAPRSRKIFVRFAWNIVVDVTQFVTILTLLILTSQLWRSKTDPSLSEWTACDRPLGVWASFWLIRLGCSIHVSRSEYHHNRRNLQSRDLEAAGASSPSSPAPASISGHPVVLDQNNAPINPRPTHSERSRRRPTEAERNYRSRLSLLTTFMTLVWFLTAHILEYASINTCRQTSPHLWWLVFGILCLMYLMIAEVILLAVTLLVIAPIIIISWNLFLYCIGRHPIQNPHQINPDIGKLPKAIVERIPLVTYIPPPPENERGGETGNWTMEYPPKPRTPAKPKTGRFKFLRRLKSKKGEISTGDNKDSTKKPEQVDWEEKWEHGDYPFVILEENRAACSICLLDFVAPQRKDLTDEEKAKVSDSVNASADAEKSNETVQESTGSTTEARSSTSPVATPNQNETGAEMPTLADAGEEAQPLRLLECGHVFHKTCLDPWLLDVSGRCPVCQRPVRTPEKEENTRRRRA